MSPRQLRQVLLMVIATLLGVGIVAVYSSTALTAQLSYGTSTWFLSRHLIAIGIGLTLGLGCLYIPYKTLRSSGKWLLSFSFVLLILAFAFGEEIGGAKRWLRFGRWNLQPSEFAQVSLIIYLADLLARKTSLIRDIRYGLLPPLLITGFIAAFVLIQPDLGTAVAMGLVSMLLLVMAKARWSHLGIVMALAAVALVFLIAGEEYRRRRILAFLNPWQDPTGSGYQILQSYFALAGGGLLGQGLGGSWQKLFYLPGCHTDFIFAIIGEELGLLGVTAVLGLFGVLISCGLRIALAAQDVFSKYLICGLVGMIGLEAMINVAVVTGLMPTKGLPLPMISYGGSSMVINLVSCALILRASRNSERYAIENSSCR